MALRRPEEVGSFFSTPHQLGPWEQKTASRMLSILPTEDEGNLQDGRGRRAVPGPAPRFRRK
jgi:hypothetical protein